MTKKRHPDLIHMNEEFMLNVAKLLNIDIEFVRKEYAQLDKELDANTERLSKVPPDRLAAMLALTLGMAGELVYMKHESAQRWLGLTMRIHKLSQTYNAGTGIMFMGATLVSIEDEEGGES